MLNLCFRKADATLHLDGNLQRVCVLSLAYLSRTTLDRQKRVGGDDKTYKSTNAHLGLILVTFLGLILVTGGFFSQNERFLQEVKLTT